MSALPHAHPDRPHILINDVSFYGPGAADQVHWDGLHDLMTPGTQSGTDEGKLMVQLAVDDSEMDLVYGDLGSTDHLAAIARAIDVLQRLQAGLIGLYAGASVPEAKLLSIKTPS